MKQSVTYFKDKKNVDFGIGEYYDRSGNQLIKNGTGEWRKDSILLDTSLLGITGHFKDSLKTGLWELKRISDQKILQTQRFRKGKFKGSVGGAFVKGPSTLFDSPSILQKRLQDEMRSGIFHKNLVGDEIEHVEIGDVNWRAIQAGGSPSGPAGIIALPDGISDKYIQNTQNKKYIQIKKISNLAILSFGAIESRIMDQIPDQNIGKLNKTEMLLLDKSTFSRSLYLSDIETFFKTISPTEIRINNRRAMYPYGDNILMAFINGKIHYPTEALLNRPVTVFVNVAIDSLGNTKDVKIFKGVSEDLDKEASRVIALIKKWLPAIQEGKAVESTITIPVKYNFKN